MVEEVLLDTNVILRHALADDPSHRRQALRLFEQTGEGTLRLLAPSPVIAQVVWTLESFYRASREYIAGLLETPGVMALEPRVVSRCREIYRTHNIEIVDAYLVALAEETNTPVLAAMNKKNFRRFPPPEADSLRWQPLLPVLCRSDRSAVMLSSVRGSWHARPTRRRRAANSRRSTWRVRSRAMGVPHALELSTSPGYPPDWNRCKTARK